MRLRSGLMMALTAQIKAQGWSQKTAAERLRVTQLRVSGFTRGKIDLFSLDTLVKMSTAGYVLAQPRWRRHRIEISCVTVKFVAICPENAVNATVGLGRVSQWFEPFNGAREH